VTKIYYVVTLQTFISQLVSYLHVYLTVWRPCDGGLIENTQQCVVDNHTQLFNVPMWWCFESWQQLGKCSGLHGQSSATWDHVVNDAVQVLHLQDENIKL